MMCRRGKGKIRFSVCGACTGKWDDFERRNRLREWLDISPFHAKYTSNTTISPSNPFILPFQVYLHFFESTAFSIFLSTIRCRASAIFSFSAADHHSSCHDISPPHRKNSPHNRRLPWHRSRHSPLPRPQWRALYPRRS